MEQYDQAGIDALVNAGRPIPGQSLTSSPEERRPFEQAPEFTKFKDALDYTASELLLKENYMPLMQSVADGVPIVDLALQIGYVGFREGRWNPDLMLMLIEPLMYLLMALAEKAGIEYKIDNEEDEDDDSMLEQTAKNISEQVKEKSAKGIPAGAIPQDILEKIETAEVSQSLLEKPEEESMVEEEQPQPQSLLERGQ